MQTHNFVLREVVKMTDNTVASAAFILLQLLDENPWKKGVKWMTHLFHKHNGNVLLMDLKSEKLTVQYHNFMRTSSFDFEYYLQLTGPKTMTCDINMRPAISAQDRLALIL